jgi:predicted peroxiredoxin
MGESAHVPAAAAREDRRVHGHEEDALNGDGKVVVNVATGLEDPERVTVALLVAGAAAGAGKEVTMFLTKEAVRLAVPGVAEGVACDGCPPIPTLATQFADAGGRLLVCPVCFNARKLREDDLVEHAQLGGATPLWQWIGDGATVFSY